MHRYLALILLAVPAFGQILRGNAGTCFSNFNNFDCIPIDGGKVWAYDMNNPGQTDCISHAVPNNATFTGSSAASMTCGGGTAPTISSTGMSIPANGNGITSTSIDLSSGFTLAATFNPTAVTAFGVCGSLNYNFPTDNIQQYASGIRQAANGDYGFYYDLSGTVHTFATAGGQITAGAWNTGVVKYTSASSTSALIWINNAVVAGSWVTGTGTPSLPAVQVETHIGGVHESGGSTCVGTLGYNILMDHAINTSAEGFIYRAFYRAMQFRGVAIP